MLELMLVLEVLMMIGLPVGLWYLVRRQEGVSWGLIVAGVVSFAASQLARYPIDVGFQWLVEGSGVWPFEQGSAGWIVVTSVYVGLAAGLCEEVARYLVLRYWRKEERTWTQGVAFGAGHGGTEAIILGLIVLVNFVIMLSLRGGDLTELGLSADELAVAQAQLESFWAMPLYIPLLGALERVFALTLQIGLTLLVVRGLVTSNLGWVALAVLGHAVVDGVAALTLQIGWSPLAVEGVILPFAAVAGWVIWKFWSVSRETSAELVTG
jgi:uncharacterized membrane protein YhfC